MTISIKRETARSFFQGLEEFLRRDEILADRQCVRMILEKEAASTTGRKRFDADKVFCQRLLFDRVDEYIDAWLRRRDLRADPFKVFRYEGAERGPVQHQTAVGPSLGYIDLVHDRLAERVPEIPDCRKAVKRTATKAIAPTFRLQFPMPFGAAGHVACGVDLKGLQRAIYETALFVATGGDSARGWTYDAGLLVAYGAEAPRVLLGTDLHAGWSDVRDRIWDAGRVWVILL